MLFVNVCMINVISEQMLTGSSAFWDRPLPHVRKPLYLRQLSPPFSLRVDTVPMDDYRTWGSVILHEVSKKRSRE